MRREKPYWIVAMTGDAIDFSSQRAAEREARAAVRTGADAVALYPGGGRRGPSFCFKKKAKKIVKRRMTAGRCLA
jgi:hypothetical protein